LLSLNKQKKAGFTLSSFAAFPSLSFNSKEIKDKTIKEDEATIDAVINEHLSQIENKVNKLQPEKIAATENISDLDPEAIAAFANFELPVETPELKKYQEQQVKEALEASKKVLTNQQWKEVEKNIAEVFTQKEKEELKSTYLKEANKFDWKQWENKLRVAYDKVDWEKVNSQLANAMNQVRMDSLQKVYSEAIGKLDFVQQELTANDIKGIPDTDVTLKEVEQRRKETQRALNNIRAIRSKKVVHL
jgi:hypothetical protein